MCLVLVGLSACCSSDSMRLANFFDAYKSNLQDSLTLNRLNALQAEIKKWKESAKDQNARTQAR